MGKQARTEYICGNCEYDFEGMPAGTRPVDGRPLCDRCTKIYFDQAPAAEPSRPRQVSGGLLTILYMLGSLVLLALALFWFLVCRDRH